ncbi:MAG: cytochrome c oxidase subunit 3 [Anaerolineaceae bacterium]|nr:cytochrome c oxidase subunit 3 [Anaerolineaceae bacterium]
MNQSLMATSPRSQQSGATARIALLITLGSETAFFGMLLAAYLYLRSDLGSWQLTQASLARLSIPGANTLLLLASAVTAAIGQQAIHKGRAGQLQTWMGATLLLGVIFIAGQVYEFTSTGMSPNDQAFGGVFFTLMGFHALHLIAGCGALALVFIRTRLGDFTARKHVAVDIGVWFWFYVVAVWVVLFSALYLV